MTTGAGLTGATILLANLLTQVQASIITLGAVALALPAIWRFMIRPVRKIVKQVAAVHTVILGNDEEGVPSLTERLASQDSRLRVGDDDFERIEAKVDDVRHDIRGEGGVIDRITNVERVFEVIGSTERLEIRSAIAAANEPRRHRHDDPQPPPPTPIRRDP